MRKKGEKVRREKFRSLRKKSTLQKKVKYDTKVLEVDSKVRSWKKVKKR